jgi:transposase
MVSVERIAQLVALITNNQIHPSEATIISCVERAAAGCDLEPIIQTLLNAQTLHTDDTPVKVTERINHDGTREISEHTTMNAYVRTYSTDSATILTANAHKDEEGIVADNILTRFHGIISHDHESKFYNYGSKHATCCAHLCRELKGMRDLNMVKWAGIVLTFFLGMYARKKEDIADNIPACDPDVLCEYEREYDELVEQGRAELLRMRENTIGYDELRKMVNRLSTHKASYMLFMRDYTAPYTNNQAERDLRRCKTKQKVSGCYRSWRGLENDCKLLSIIDTAKKRGECVLAAITSCLRSPALAPC